ncbi:uncharacterized protein LOC132704892 isoform X2 [Cylas formicarius]|uniref:uncharacterized protein LOC132704892 isoform X2 n=1 Tax=Cylas formicarius TaxID=197179 RepID=UPI00295851A3|nr:uncharacterized protein LOC132704892 isoform X2 [Cylas formicarius]
MSERKGLFRFARLSMIAACMWNLDLPAFSKFTKLMYQTYSVVLPALVFLVPVLMIANFPSLLLTDPNSAIEVTPKMLYCAVLVIKTFSYQSSRCRYLLTAAMEEESRLYFINDDEVVRIYEEHIRYCRIFFKFFCISTMLPVSTECEIAIIKSYKFSQNLDAVGDKPMPLVSWYPFDKNRHHIWVMAHQFISIIVTGCYVLSVYVYYTSIMIYVRSRLLILQHYFRNYDQYQLDGESTTLETLKVLCAKHQDLINYINDVNRSVKMTVFLEYSVISILLATILYQLVEVVVESLYPQKIFWTLNHNNSETPTEK